MLLFSTLFRVVSVASSGHMLSIMLGYIKMYSVEVSVIGLMSGELHDRAKSMTLISHQTRGYESICSMYA